MPSTPRVSVVVPAFNAVDLVVDALDSLRAQTFEGFEVIVVDDGSTDGTGAQVDAIAAADPRVRVVRHAENLGLLASLADGLAAAGGELIARLDADDLSTPDRLRQQVAAFDADPQLVLCWTAYERRTLHDGAALGTVVPPLEHAAMQLALATANRILHSSVMFRAATVRALGGYLPEWYPAEDYDLWCRLLATGTGCGLATAGSVSRVNPAGISSSNHQVQQETMARRAALERVRYGIPARVRAQGWGFVADRRALVASVRGDLRRRQVSRRGLTVELVRRTAYDLADRSRVQRWALVALVAPTGLARFVVRRLREGRGS